MIASRPHSTRGSLSWQHNVPWLVGAALSARDRTGTHPLCPRWEDPNVQYAAERSVEGATPGAEESADGSDESEKSTAA